LNLIRGKDLGQQIDAAFGLRAAMYRHTISIVTHGELRVLAARNNWGDQKKDALAAALNSLVTINIDSDPLVQAYVRVEEACRNAPGAHGQWAKMICGSPRRLCCAICRSLQPTMTSTISMGG
jgi:hypothetical protein